MPSKSGGPKTPAGKKRSSENSTAHGLRSTRPSILPDEAREEYDETRRGWIETYEPDGYHEVRLVEQLILNEWLLKRANRRLMEAEAEEDLTDEGEHRRELIQRYKTTSERAFYRALSAVEGLRKDILREKFLSTDLLKRKSEEIEELKKKLGAQQLPKKGDGRAESTAAGKMFQGQRAKKKRRHIPVLDQWVEIEVSLDGKTLTTLYPSNEVLIQSGQKQWPAPELVYRRLHFVDGVPEEYAWTTAEESIRVSGGLGIQRMTVDRWLELIETEKARGTGASAAVWGKFAEAGRARRMRVSGVFAEPGDF